MKTHDIFTSACGGFRLSHFFLRCMEAALAQPDEPAFLAFAALIERGEGCTATLQPMRERCFRSKENSLSWTAVRVNADCTAETLSMPLLSIVDEEGCTRFVEYRRQLATWHGELAALGRQVQEQSDHESLG